MMHKVLAVIEIEISAPDDATDAAICESFGDLCALLPHHLQRLGDLDEDYQDNVIYTDVTPLSVKVLNSSTSSALNHLYSHYTFDLETRSHDDMGDTADTSTQLLGMASFSSKPLQAGGPPPTRDEALLLFGVNPDVLAVEIRPEPPFDLKTSVLSSEPIRPIRPISRMRPRENSDSASAQSDFERSRNHNEPSNRIGLREGRNMVLIDDDDLQVRVHVADDPEEPGTKIVWYTGLSADLDGRITQYKPNHRTGKMEPLDRDPGIHPLHTESPTGRMVPTYPAQEKTLEDCKPKFPGNPANFEGLDPNMFDIGKKMIDFFRNPFAKEAAGTKELDAKLRAGTVSGRVSHKVPNGHTPSKHPSFEDYPRVPNDKARARELEMRAQQDRQREQYAAADLATIAILSQTIANSDLETIIDSGTKLNALWPERDYVPGDVAAMLDDPAVFKSLYQQEWPDATHADEAARNAVEAPTSVVNDAKVDEPSRSYEPSPSSYEAPSSSSDSYSSSSDSSSDTSSSYSAD